MNKPQPIKLVNKVINIARNAGEAIMKIHQTDFSYQYKTDHSPVTEADTIAHNTIINGLKSISLLPCVSEESGEDENSWLKRKEYKQYWLIDPLDGTKEFINGNNEFTVNIALISNHKPILGVVYCPALEITYYATTTDGAFKQLKNEKPKAIKVSKNPTINQLWKVLGSRYHGETDVSVFVNIFENKQTILVGSSLKLCYIAEGSAHLYPRFAPTYEWDIAASQIILEMAGGKLLTENSTPLQYGKTECLLNPLFVACNEISPIWIDHFLLHCRKIIKKNLLNPRIK